MTKILKLSFCILFFAFCLFFSIATVLPGASAVAEGDTERPPFIVDGLPDPDFGSKYENYFSKAFAYRSCVVDIYSGLRAKLFAEGNDQVIVGRDGFLFFAETLDAYTGANPMTDAEIAAAADSLGRLSEYAAERGAALLFVCAPDKNTVYSEYMPARYLKSTAPTDLDRLYAALSERKVSYADLREPLLSGRNVPDGDAPDKAVFEKEILLYHKRDTHWNADGARIAYKAIAGGLGIEAIDIAALTRTDAHDLRGDLDTLLYPGRTLYDDNPTYDFSELYIFTSAYSTPMDMQITARGAGKGKALIFRDSFANALIPFLASSFSETRFERAIPYRADLLGEFDADYVIIEIAERNLRSLIGSDERIR